MLNLTFDNQFTAQMPSDSETGSRQRQFKQSLFGRVHPKAAPEPQLIHFSREMASLLDLTEEQCRSEEFAKKVVQIGLFHEHVVV